MTIEEAWPLVREMSAATEVSHLPISAPQVFAAICTVLVHVANGWQPPLSE